MKRFVLSAVLSLAISCIAFVASPALAEMYEDSTVIDSSSNSVTGLYFTPKLIGFSQHVRTAPGCNRDTLLGFTLAMGYDFYKRFDLPIRLEAEYGFNKSSEHGFTWSNLSANSKIRIQTAMVNAYYDLHYFGNLVPYIAGGIGAGFVKHSVGGVITNSNGSSNGFSSKHTDTSFAAQIGFGASYLLTDNIAVDFGYRWVKIDDAGNDIAVNDLYIPLKAKHIDTHQLMLGARYTF